MTDPVDDDVVLGTLVAVDDIRAGDVVDVVANRSTGATRVRLHHRAAGQDLDATRVDLGALTWPCMVCGEERPDAVIGVARRPVEGHEGLFPDTMRWNVRHCTDRPDCVAVANAPGPWRGREDAPA